MVKGEVGVPSEIGGARSMSRCGKMVKASCSASTPRVDATARTKQSRRCGSVLEEGESQEGLDEALPGGCGVADSKAKTRHHGVEE